MPSKFIKEISSVLEMLDSLEKEYNLIGYNQTEKKVYYTIVKALASEGTCNITDIINISNLSRSTVYKSIKKFEKNKLLQLDQSNYDKRESNLTILLAV